MQAALRYAKYALAAPAIDAVLKTFPILCRRAPPWRAINYGGIADYIANGDSVARNLVRHALLKPDETVLEIGMGIAGNATALYRKFGDHIDYRGFDAVSYGVTWSRQHFANVSKKYKFDYGDIYNSFYNPRGHISPTDYIFPYTDEIGDLIFANSVFTHMQPSEVIHYFHESARVLKRGGRTWFTFFLIDDDAEKRIAAGQTRYSFKHAHGACKIEIESEPDVAVAYPLDWVERQLDAAGFDIKQIERSSWRGNSAQQLQDVVVAVRR